MRTGSILKKMGNGIYFDLPSQEKSRLRKQSAFFSYIRLRRVILLCSDIRLTPSDIRFASLGGEYNITAKRSRAISLSLATISRRQSRHITKNFPTSPKLWTDSNRHTVGDDLPGVPNKFVQTGRRGRRPLQLKNHLQSHRCKGILDRFGLSKRR